MSIRTPAHPSTHDREAAIDAASVALDLDALRLAAPLVQCITNAVVTGFTANSLLALGASPAMCDLPGEAGVFAGLASATLVNLGTPGAEQRGGAREAVAAAVAASTPWVLDPVAVGPLPVRTALAVELLEARPAIIRGNASEILALAGLGAGGRGVDAVDGAEEALDAARVLARRSGGAVTVSGPVDVITDGDRVVRVTGGDALLTRVTGGGCALGAVMAAFSGSGLDPLRAAVAGSVVWGLAAERAAEVSAGPGSFAVALLDALAALEGDDVLRGARIS